MQLTQEHEQHVLTQRLRLRLSEQNKFLTSEKSFLSAFCIAD